MKTNLQIILLLAVGLFASSCAATYKRINPNGLQYGSKPTEEGLIEYGYKYHVLEDARNKKYAKDEKKKNVQVVAVKIRNKSDQEISFDQLHFYAYDQEYFPLRNEAITQKIKQNYWWHLFYVLLNPTFTSQSGGEVNSSGPYYIGPIIAGANIAVGAVANNNFKKELMAYDLRGKTLKPGETVHTLLGFRDLNYAPLEIRVSPNTTVSN